MQLVRRANDYSSNDGDVVTPWKALLLNNVAAGRECVMRRNDATLTAPPRGYDSVGFPGLVLSRGN